MNQGTYHNCFAYTYKQKAEMTANVVIGVSKTGPTISGGVSIKTGTEVVKYFKDCFSHYVCTGCFYETKDFSLDYKNSAYSYLLE